MHRWRWVTYMGWISYLCILVDRFFETLNDKLNFKKSIQFPVGIYMHRFRDYVMTRIYFRQVQVLVDKKVFVTPFPQGVRRKIFRDVWNSMYSKNNLIWYLNFQCLSIDCCKYNLTNTVKEYRNTISYFTMGLMHHLCQFLCNEILMRSSSTF